jgi:excisionase family DNA binding protein
MERMIAMKAYLTTKDVCEILKVSRETLYNWRKDGLPFTRVMTTIRYNLDEVRRWIEEQNKIEEDSNNE